MRISVEISLYPLRDDYLAPIEAFIERLGTYGELTVLTSTMSTRVFGEYDRVFEVLHAEIKRVHATTPHAVFVTKIIGGDLQPGEDGRYT